MAIHPTAIVDPSARLADGVVIGPWCTVGPGVDLGADVHLVSHVVLQQDTSVGARTVIHPFAVIGGDPQHGGYKGETVRLEIGADNTIREHDLYLTQGAPKEKEFKLKSPDLNDFQEKDDVNEKPKPMQGLLLAMQHLFAMFGSTVLVPILVGLIISISNHVDVKLSLLSP